MKDVVWIRWNQPGTDWNYFYIDNASSHDNLASFVEIQIEEDLYLMGAFDARYSWEIIDMPPTEHKENSGEQQ